MAAVSCDDPEAGGLASGVEREPWASRTEPQREALCQRLGDLGLYEAAVSSDTSTVQPRTAVVTKDRTARPAASNTAQPAASNTAQPAAKDTAPPADRNTAPPAAKTSAQTIAKNAPEVFRPTV